MRLMASSVRRFLVCESIFASGSSPSTIPSRLKRYGSVSSSERSRVLSGSRSSVNSVEPLISAIIDPALKLMIEAVRRYDGYVVQSTGDGIFALFGAPLAHEDHPQRALYAALRLQEELERYSARLREGGNLPIEGGVGVTT